MGKRKETTKIEKVAEFILVYNEKIDRLILALVWCGYLTKIQNQDQFSKKIIVYRIV